MRGIASKDRACGACNACCDVYDVHQLRPMKPQWTLCRHWESGTGCRIYAKRPLECRNFVCWWRVGRGSVDDRPDRIGCMLDQMPLKKVGTSLMISEMEPGAVGRSSFVQEMIAAAMAKRQGIWIRRQNDPDTLLAPRGIEMEGSTDQTRKKVVIEYY